MGCKRTTVTYVKSTIYSRVIGEIAMPSMIDPPNPEMHLGPCRICGSLTGRSHAVREMMFGFRDWFHYFECGSCGCLQLTDPPADMARYYPPQRYYSFQPPADDATTTFPGGLVGWMMRRRNEAELFGGGVPGRLLSRLFPRRDLRWHQRRFAHMPIHHMDARILDIGCGSGQLLREWAGFGFNRLQGVDPYLPHDIDMGPSLRIHARSVEAMPDERFDLVMIHHAFEHMADPLAALRSVARMLAPRGACLIRIPIATPGPWAEYGVDWAEIDAPRHHFIHTPRSLAITADRAGLEIYHTEYEHDDLVGYYGSELYRRDLPLYDEAAGQYRDIQAAFTPAELQEFARRARQAAHDRVAGRAAFYLRAMASAKAA